MSRGKSLFVRISGGGGRNRSRRIPDRTFIMLTKKTLFDNILSKLNLSQSHVYSILDFGCGNGDFLGLVSRNVNAESELVGIDERKQFIQEAKARNPGITFACEKFKNKLDLPDASFDLIVTIDVLECVGDKDALLSEFYRILKPRGRVLAAHWDWDTMLYSVKSKDIARKAISAFSDWKQPWMDNSDGQMGRKLLGLFESEKQFFGKPDCFNLIETSYEPGTYGFDRMQDIAKLVDAGGISKREYEKLQGELTESNQKGRYFFSLTSFIYYGQKVCDRAIKSH